VFLCLFLFCSWAGGEGEKTASPISHGIITEPKAAGAERGPDSGRPCLAGWLAGWLAGAVESDGLVYLVERGVDGLQQRQSLASTK
jgi:hypothetical protein